MDDVERIDLEIDTAFEPAGQALAEWLESHGIDRDDVALPGWVERRPAAREIAWIAYARLSCGVIATDPAGEPLREVRVRQLDTVPAPIPAEARGGR